MVVDAATLLQRKVWQFIMVDCKNKVVKQKYQPKNKKEVGQGGNPDQYYSYKPSWNFASCDKERWSLFDESTKQIFWEKIMPTLQSLETQYWKNILVDAKKQNHSIDVNNLNKIAINRIAELNMECESLISLTLQGQYRLYGYMNRSVFNLLWVDLDHGDNETCVCKSKKRHT